MQHLLAAAVFLTLVMLLLAWAHRRFSIIEDTKQRNQLDLLGRAPLQKRRPRKVLVLDLDETMVHADMSPDGGIMLLLRPHLGEFLQRANALFDELIVFTAATQEYADRALEHVEQVSGVRLRRRYYRDSCSINAYGEVAKDLRILREDAGTVAFLLDNTPSAYSLQPEAGIAIKSYVRDDPTDVALLDTLDAIGASRMSGAGSRHGFTFEV
jgi:TFIIF-interacting CTD phosphatase-like protein